MAFQTCYIRHLLTIKTFGPSQIYCLKTDIYYTVLIVSSLDACFLSLYHMVQTESITVSKSSEEHTHFSAMKTLYNIFHYFQMFYLPPCLCISMKLLFQETTAGFRYF